MDHTYESSFEKETYGEKPNYVIHAETTNFSCYQELKDLITTTIAQYELAESIAEKAE